MFVPKPCYFEWLILREMTPIKNSDEIETYLKKRINYLSPTGEDPFAGV